MVSKFGMCLRVSGPNNLFFFFVRKKKPRVEKHFKVGLDMNNLSTVMKIESIKGKVPERNPKNFFPKEGLPP